MCKRGVFYRAGSEHIGGCAELMKQSGLAEKYYTCDSTLLSALEKGMVEDEFFVLIDDGAILGFVWFRTDGAFHIFPYLHMVVVNEAIRRTGIGRRLVEFYEQQSLRLKNALRSKSFLVVADFNEGAMQMYRSIGYSEIAPIRDLFRKGISETLMVRTIVRDKTWEPDINL